MVTRLTKLFINDVSSVRRVAGENCNVVFTKAAGAEAVSFDDIRKAAYSKRLPLSELFDAIDNEIVKTGLSVNAITAQCDHPLNPYISLRVGLERDGIGKAGIDIQGAGGLPPDGSKAGTAFQTLVDERQKKYPGEKLSVSHAHVTKSPAGIQAIKAEQARQGIHV